MTFQQELTSWFSPTFRTPLASPPKIGSRAPQTPSTLPTPLITPSEPTILTFLRHCGCPWAEKTYLSLRSSASQNPSITFVAISHSSEKDTAEWLSSLPGPSTSDGKAPPNLRVLVDEKSDSYAAWGLGTASWGHVVSPAALWEVYKAARDEGLRNRPTRSGSRWQRSGSFAVDGDGIVRWGRPTERADEVLDFQEGVERISALGGEQAKL